MLEALELLGRPLPSSRAAPREYQLATWLSYLESLLLQSMAEAQERHEREGLRDMKTCSEPACHAGPGDRGRYKTIRQDGTAGH